MKYIIETLAASVEIAVDYIKFALIVVALGCVFSAVGALFNSLSP